ncbi:Arc family DNA-binding protein [Acinetobacter vivianii]|uniref:Arc family DNA-binding protein n=1 Tax=Acinetobacter vivianii TaxID=1776742 RepID=UPI0040423BF0
MSNQADHTIVRLRVPPELKEKIEKAAEENNRSQSAEMVARLEQSFELKQAHETEMHLMSIAYKELKESSLSTQKQLEAIIKTQDETLLAITSLLKQAK